MCKGVRSMTMPKRLENSEARELTARMDQPMEMSVKDVVGQAQKVLEIMRQTMREGIHYGAVIPGTNKRSLLKPGAERLCLTFRLAPSFNIRGQDLDGGHREYEIVCTLRHQPTDMVLGEGVGCCSTMESKYRWRWENTGRLVPPDYWKKPAILRCLADRTSWRGRSRGSGGSFTASSMTIRPTITTRR